MSIREGAIELDVPAATWSSWEYRTAFPSDDQIVKLGEVLRLNKQQYAQLYKEQHHKVKTKTATQEDLPKEKAAS